MVSGNLYILSAASNDGDGFAECVHVVVVAARVRAGSNYYCVTVGGVIDSMLREHNTHEAQAVRIPWWTTVDDGAKIWHRSWMHTPEW